MMPKNTRDEMLATSLMGGRKGKPAKPVKGPEDKTKLSGVSKPPKNRDGSEDVTWNSPENSSSKSAKTTIVGKRNAKGVDQDYTPSAITLHNVQSNLVDIEEKKPMAKTAWDVRGDDEREQPKVKPSKTAWDVDGDEGREQPEPKVKKSKTLWDINDDELVAAPSVTKKLDLLDLPQEPDPLPFEEVVSLPPVNDSVAFNPETPVILEDEPAMTPIVIPPVVAAPKRMPNVSLDLKGLWGNQLHQFSFAGLLLATLGLMASGFFGLKIIMLVCGVLTLAAAVVLYKRPAPAQSPPTFATPSESSDSAIYDLSEQLKQLTKQHQQEQAKVNNLQNATMQYSNIALQIAEGNLTKRSESDGLGQGLKSINMMIQELANFVKDIQSTSTTISQGSDQVLGTSHHMTQNVQRQVHESQKVRQGVYEVVKGIQLMTQQATQSSQVVQQSLQVSQLGQQAIAGTLQGMQAIRQDVQRMAERVEQLGQRSKEINEVVETISEIASQTNLLALGAALEAAGAGEAGRRFAVVANEVGILAERSSSATQRVSSLIQKVQLDVQDIMNESKKSTQQTEQGYQIASQAGQHLQEVSEISKQSAQLAEQMSKSTVQQIARLEQVTQVIEQLASVSKQSQEQVMQGREAAQTLQALATKLSESLSRFRVA
jgi:methyl-accepting chemotaxis protein